MTGAKAYTLGYVAQTARQDEFHRQAEEHRVAAAAAGTRPSRRRFALRLRRRRVQPTGRQATTTA